MYALRLKIIIFNCNAYILLLVVYAFNKKKEGPEDGLVDRNRLPKKKLITKYKVV